MQRIIHCGDGYAVDVSAESEQGASVSRPANRAATEMHGV